jgi:hypothetical protein
VNTRIKIDKKTSVINKEIYVNQLVKQGRSIFSILLNIFVDKDITQWQDVSAEGFKIGDTILNTILFAEDQSAFND